MIAAIVAVDENWGIGYNGELLEKIPEDMQRFKDLTKNNTIIMGRKTWESLPNKPLPNRTNCVITTRDLRVDDVWMINLDEAIGMCASNLKVWNNIFIIGGASIYEQLLPYCDKLYITRIHKKYKNVDTYFPDISNDPHWTQIACSLTKEYNGIGYHFETYNRQHLIF